MADQGLMISIQVADLALDEEGKVIIRNPAIAEQVAAAMKRAETDDTPTPRVNNCHGGNCAAGCHPK
ncbi:hypothetical protein [Nannocystis punicea]|uniref:Uncharacterized protein n=1 Tax=Nannocystis punicea TaxID=2995304 RepID=A0ABY7GXW7_9BACT|nr:hypothetical protein [Nannocystis poenicansa]WAS91807.1 hypothetical protein O0S08_36960 [Nannocystis poenicansa]